MIERNITHKDAIKTIREGVKQEEIDGVRAICEVESRRYITVCYAEKEKLIVVKTVFENNHTDIELYRRLKK